MNSSSGYFTPVGPILQGRRKADHHRKVCDFDRAAPRGTGRVKAGLNYAMSSRHHDGAPGGIRREHVPGCGDQDEGGGDRRANFLFVTKDHKVVTPKSGHDPSVHHQAVLMYVAEHYLGLEVEEREVPLAELEEFAECGPCGTAAVISPVGKVVDHGREICFPSGMEEMGPVTKKLYETLTGIQMGQIEASEGWICRICYGNNGHVNKNAILLRVPLKISQERGRQCSRMLSLI